MALNIYWTSLFILVLIVVLLMGRNFILRLFRTKNLEKDVVLQDVDAEARKFRIIFLRVYLVVMGSEWLQTPYLYSLFHDEKGFDTRTVAILYVATYLSAAVSALFTGYMADKLGRRTACFIFCGIHSLASISVKSNDIRILVAGRVFSGIGLNLLWTAFESWMIAEYNARKFDQSSLRLSSMLSIMTTYNCMTAIVAGVIGYCIVLISGSKTDPFIAGANENKGPTNSAAGPCDEEGLGSDTTDDKITKKTTGNLKDVRIWVLSLASCCFEGAIFIFTFSWPGTLQAAHGTEHSEKGDAIPYGAIFSAFMATMVLGTMLFRLLIRTMKSETTDEILLFSAILPTLILGTTFFMGALSLLIAAFSRRELDTYLAFLLLELCNGVYVPSMAYHRSLIVNDSSRAMVYGFMNIPLFIFVVIAVYATSGDDEQRQTLFASSALLPIIAALAIILGFDLQNIRSKFTQVKIRETESVEKDVIEVESTK
ncbi:MFS general substrate transporter [Rostrohypoxylon terebratum]|nr:MFS general substrate transporter [Rostrohypoxylon terebratum]